MSVRAALAAADRMLRLQEWYESPDGRLYEQWSRASAEWREIVRERDEQWTFAKESDARSFLTDEESEILARTTPQATVRDARTVISGTAVTVGVSALVAITVSGVGWLLGLFIPALRGFTEVVFTIAWISAAALVIFIASRFVQHNAAWEEEQDSNARRTAIDSVHKQRVRKDVSRIGGVRLDERGAVQITADWASAWVREALVLFPQYRQSVTEGRFQTTPPTIPSLDPAITTIDRCDELNRLLHAWGPADHDDGPAVGA